MAIEPDHPAIDAGIDNDQVRTVAGMHVHRLPAVRTIDVLLQMFGNQDRGLQCSLAKFSAAIANEHRKDVAAHQHTVTFRAMLDLQPIHGGLAQATATAGASLFARTIERHDPVSGFVGNIDRPERTANPADGDWTETIPLKRNVAVVAVHVDPTLSRKRKFPAFNLARKNYCGRKDLEKNATTPRLGLIRA